MQALERRRRIAVSVFVCLHLLALGWWSFGVVDYRVPEQVRPGQEDAFTRLQAAADTVDPGGHARGALVAYVRASGLWQRWILFGPDAPHETGRFEVVGITGIDAHGQPILDPDVLHSSDEPVITDRTQIIGNPPCGFTRSADPKAQFLVASYAQYWAHEVARERARSYEGVLLRCVRRPVPQPDQDPDALPWTTEILWAGPLMERAR